MALRLSKALRNFINAGGSLRQALNNGTITFYTGPQPTNADDAVAGTPLVIFTSGGLAHTPEVRAQGSVTLTGSGGSFDTLTINGLDVLGGAVAYLTSLTITAAAIARKVNNNPMNWLFVASANAGVITFTAKPGLGAAANGMVVASTVSGGTLGKTDVNIGTTTAGVTAVNGLTWEVSANGTMLKNTDETWEGEGLDDGTAGWFRWTGSVADAGAADAAEVFIRLDGSIAASGAQFNGVSTSIVTGATQTITGDEFQIPAS